MNHTTTFDYYLNQLIKQSHFVGFVVLVEQANTPAWLHAYGLANIEKNIATTTNDLYRIASATKPFIATLVVKLAIDKKINLDNKLADYLPTKAIQHIDNAKQVTIRQLLNMRSGIYNYTDNPKYAEFVSKNPQHQWQPMDALAFARDMPANFKPGTAGEYSNTNYILLGMLVETVSNDTLANQLKTRIFSPLGLTNTYLEKHQVIPAPIVPGYRYQHQQYQNMNAIDDGRGLADGGIVSNAKDLNHFIRSLLNDDEFMPPKWRQQMLDFHPLESADHVKYGLGLISFPSPYGEIIGHDGNNPGYQSWMIYIPAKQTSIIFLNNNNPPKLNHSKFLTAEHGFIEKALKKSAKSQPK